MTLTDRDTAFRFCETLFRELEAALSDPVIVRERMVDAQARIMGRGSSMALREEHFCKACVLPVVDSVATRFLAAELSLTREEIHAALRCEGFSNLSRLYVPGDHQSGFSGPSWGKNRQMVNKQGRTAPPGSPGFLPCPDFGIVHCDYRKFSLVGETKVHRDSETVSIAEVERQTRYYVGLPCEPEKGWDYDFGFGIAYAAGGEGPRRSRLITDHWQSDGFVIAHFQA